MGARRGPPAVPVELDDAESETLERWARGPKSSQALALRCRIPRSASDPSGVAEDFPLPPWPHRHQVCASGR